MRLRAASIFTEPHLRTGRERREQCRAKTVRNQHPRIRKLAHAPYGGPSDGKLDALVRGASNFTGRWPTISNWHGGRDTTVDSSNADSIVRQWQKIHQVEGPPTRVEQVDGFPRQVWCDAEGRVVIEKYIVERMGHGTPTSARGEAGLGEESKYMLEVGISSIRRIADFWGLTA